MTGPDDDRTVEQPVVETPSVSTAPPPSRPHSWWSSIPSHLGRARTSTVVLAVLFLTIGALYLNVRPDPVRPGTGGSSVEPTAPASTTAPPTTTAPETTAPTEDLPTTTPEPTTSESPVETTEPAPEPTPSDLPTTTAEPTPPPEPSIVSPPG